MKSILMGAFAVLACAAGASDASAQFYQGKRLTILVNYAAGGPTDIEARVLTRHLARHLDGAPTVIVQNMDGAAGLIGPKLSRRDRAAGRHDGRLLHRHGLPVRQRHAPASRRLSDL